MKQKSKMSARKLNSVRVVLVGISLWLLQPASLQAQTSDTGMNDDPLRIAIVGMVHGHLHFFIREAMARPDIEVVGIVESDQALLRTYGDRYEVPADRRFKTVAELYNAVVPEAVMLFTNTFDHKAVVEASAKQGVHVMMEKPLAVNMEHANAIKKAAQEGGIQVLVNYETTWYPVNDVIHELQESGKLGTLRKMVVHDGHFGPKEIGVQPEFLNWLTDPVLNGGGALTDFGCYGANLMTWLMKGEAPISVTALIQQLKDDPAYAKVDDETTIIVEYEQAQGIIQASWNWPYHRKDMEIYGDAGYVIAPNRNSIRYSEKNKTPEPDREAPALDPSKADVFSYLKGVVRGTIEVADHEPSSLENNMMVTRILDAARQSALTGRRVLLNPN